MTLLPSSDKIDLGFPASLQPPLLGNLGLISSFYNNTRIPVVHRACCQTNEINALKVSGPAPWGGYFVAYLPGMGPEDGQGRV